MTMPTATPQYTLHITSSSAERWICDDDCSQSNDIRVEIGYLFGNHIEYNMENMECFMYQILLKYLHNYQFNICDIQTNDIYGGIEAIDHSSFCSIGPCLHRGNLSTTSDDGNMTMIILSDSDLNHLSLDSMKKDFESLYLNQFAVDIDVIS